MTNIWVKENVKLTKYETNHDQKTIKWLQDEMIRDSFGHTYVPNLSEHRNWIESLKDTFVWAIYDNQLNFHCGNILLFVNPKHYSAFFQIYIGESMSRGKGIAKNTLIIILDFAFEELKLNRVWLNVFPENKKALNLYESLGFIKEGIERQSHYYNSCFRNQLRYSMLKSDWTNRVRD